MKNEIREDVINKIIHERDYQDHLCTIKNLPQTPTVEGELVMLKTYIDKTLVLWTKNHSKEQILSEFRKISSIAVRCLENHGCPNRKFGDLMNDLSK